MRIRSDRKPFERSVPTQSSLAFAGQIAELMGLPFDKEDVEDQSRTLYEAMFEDLIQVLDLKDNTIRFESGYFHATRAFVLKGADGDPQISLDTTFDYWISALCLLSAIATFEVPTTSQWESLVRQTDSSFRLFDDATRFAAAREGMMPYLTGYHHLLNLSEGLSRAMLVFALCHELAHCRLEHLEEAAHPMQELEADRMAARDFRRVIEYGEKDRNTTVHVDLKLAGAPVIFMQLCDLHEDWLRLQGRKAGKLTSHPRALERLHGINPILMPVQTETAQLLVDGFRAGTGDIKNALAGKLPN